MWWGSALAGSLFMMWVWSLSCLLSFPVSHRYLVFLSSTSHPSPHRYLMPLTEPDIRHRYLVILIVPDIHHRDRMSPAVPDIITGPSCLSQYPPDIPHRSLGCFTDILHPSHRSFSSFLVFHGGSSWHFVCPSPQAISCCFICCTNPFISKTDIACWWRWRSLCEAHPCSSLTAIRSSVLSSNVCCTACTLAVCDEGWGSSLSGLFFAW